MGYTEPFEQIGRTQLMSTPLHCCWNSLPVSRESSVICEVVFSATLWRQPRNRSGIANSPLRALSRSRIWILDQGNRMHVLCRSQKSTWHGYNLLLYTLKCWLGGTIPSTLLGSKGIMELSYGLVSLNISVCTLERVKTCSVAMAPHAMKARTHDVSFFAPNMYSCIVQLHNLTFAEAM